MATRPVNTAILGCGYVAEFYGATLGNAPEVRACGAYDINPTALAGYLKVFPGRAYETFDALLRDSEVEMVLNLTNPRVHFETTQRCLLAGKHVYSEKPLGMTLSEATALSTLAHERGLQLASAPCSVLSDTAQTLCKAVRDGVIGRIRLVYANFDDGMIAPRMSPWNWTNRTGAHWPAKDEFEVGCTYEHAGYVLTWLAALFGPARTVSSFASCQIPDKGIPVDSMAPDFTVGCIGYDNGIVARVTCGLVAPHDKSLTLIGDNGILSVTNVREDTGPVWLQRYSESGWRGRLVRYGNQLKRRLEHQLTGVPWPAGDWNWRQRLPLISTGKRQFVSASKPVDFSRGPQDLAQAIRDSRPSRLGSELGVHIVELVEALQHPERRSEGATLRTQFAPILPLNRAG